MKAIRTQVETGRAIFKNRSSSGKLREPPCDTDDAKVLTTKGADRITPQRTAWIPLFQGPVPAPPEKTFSLARDGFTPSRRRLSLTSLSAPSTLALKSTSASSTCPYLLLKAVRTCWLRCTAR